MSQSKFSMNALMIIVAIFSGLTFIFTVKMVNLQNPFPVNEFYPIEGTKYAVKYSTYDPNGIYKGIESACTLVLEGTYGNGWGEYREGNDLYVNEYDMTDLGLVNCRLVKINLETFEKEELMKDALLRGTCASGELVVLSGFTLDSSAPATNSMVRLYSMTSAELRPEGKSAVVNFIDPKTGETVYSFRDDRAAEEGYVEEQYLSRTLEEVRG